MSDSNVGLGMVPHRASCRCDECENVRLRERKADLERQIAELKARNSGLEDYYYAAEELMASENITQDQVLELEIARAAIAQVMKR